MNNSFMRSSKVSNRISLCLETNLTLEGDILPLFYLHINYESASDQSIQPCEGSIMYFQYSFRPVGTIIFLTLQLPHGIHLQSEYIQCSAEYSVQEHI